MFCRSSGSRPSDKSLEPYGADEASQESDVEDVRQALGKVVLGSINDRSARAGLVFGISCGVVGVLLMLLVPRIPVSLFAGAFLFGCVYACTTVQSPLLVRSVFGERDYTAIYSRVSIAGSLCSAIAAVFWAWVSELPGGYVLMFGLSIVAMVTACFWASPPSGRKGGSRRPPNRGLGIFQEGRPVSYRCMLRPKQYARTLCKTCVRVCIQVRVWKGSTHELFRRLAIPSHGRSVG